MAGRKQSGKKRINNNQSEDVGRGGTGIVASWKASTALVEVVEAEYHTQGSGVPVGRPPLEVAFGWEGHPWKLLGNKNKNKPGLGISTYPTSWDLDPCPQSVEDGFWPKNTMETVGVGECTTKREEEGT